VAAVAAVAEEVVVVVQKVPQAKSESALSAQPMPAHWTFLQTEMTRV
jgi:hypothetical protein